jgi:hypothetical protein
MGESGILKMYGGEGCGRVGREGTLKKICTIQKKIINLQRCLCGRKDVENVL